MEKMPNDEPMHCFSTRKCILQKLGGAAEKHAGEIEHAKDMWSIFDVKRLRSIPNQS